MSPPSGKAREGFANGLVTKYQGYSATRAFYIANSTGSGQLMLYVNDIVAGTPGTPVSLTGPSGVTTLDFATGAE